MNDAEFTARLRGATEPRPQTPDEVVAFSEGIEARIARRRRRRWQLRGVAATAALAAVAWLVLPADREGAEGQGDLPQEVVTTARPLTEAPAGAIGGSDVAGWENEILLETSVRDDDTSESEGLPDEYWAIASIFLEG